MDNKKYKGRGAQKNLGNSFQEQEYVHEHIEGIDEDQEAQPKTEVFYESPKTIVNKVGSPDIPMGYSLNPYQGCEHGCVYCYARNSHEYWGFNAGLDFERKIVVKKDVRKTLVKQLSSKNWKVMTIMLSGNTDCYQPLEKKLRSTRIVLELMNECNHPVGIITKNALVTRDIDILSELASKELTSVNISINSLDEEVRNKLEPRTSTSKNKLRAVEQLSKAGIPVNVLIAPVIPGLNDHEIPKIIQAASEHGASSVGYITVRLNGKIGEVFEDWLLKTFPSKAGKVLNQIKAIHGGKLNSSEYRERMRGHGKEAEMIKRMFHITQAKYFKGQSRHRLRTDLFIPPNGKQLDFFA